MSQTVTDDRMKRAMKRMRIGIFKPQLLQRIHSLSEHAWSNIRYILISWKLSLPGRHLMFIIITEYIPKLIEHVDIIDVGTKTRSGVVAIVNKLP